MGMISPILDDYMPTAQCTTRTGGRLTDRSRASEVPATAAAPPPALPEIVEPQFRQAPISAMDTSGQCPQDSTSAGSPRLYPPLLESTDGKGEENTGIRGCTPPRNRGKEPHYRCPSESYNSLRFRTHGALPSAPCSLSLPAIFLYRYIKLAETRSTVLGGAASHD